MEPLGARSRRAARRVAGGAWLAAWCAVLWAVAAPWRSLGGLESERLRWMEWWALCSGLALGYTLGQGTREWVLGGEGRSHARALRFALYPPALVAALALVMLSLWGERGPIGVVATAFLAYWAGMDVAFGAVPLMEGRSYSLTRPLEAEAVDDGNPPRPTWDRL
ncbi:MAG TPA: hypothetical protein VFB67_02015 [Candidatus Polarisedimenticolaceae bacterium]|nr:hypothetical protein [Candidatus Polarisedimenticolaceae bacterium]